MDSPCSQRPTAQMSEDDLAGAEILQHLRAQTATEAELGQLREDARLAGEAKYATGPGRKRSRAWEDLPETDPVYKREKKTRSAYVSRFKATAYRELLETRVGDIVRGNDERRAELDRSRAAHRKLQEELAALRAQVAAGAPLGAPTPAAVAHSPIAPASPAPAVPAALHAEDDLQDEALSAGEDLDLLHEGGAPARPHCQLGEDEDDDARNAHFAIPDSPVSPASSVCSRAADPAADEYGIQIDPFDLLPPSYAKIFDLSPIEADGMASHFGFAQ